MAVIGPFLSLATDTSGLLGHSAFPAKTENKMRKITSNSLLTLAHTLPLSSAPQLYSWTAECLVCVSEIRRVTQEVKHTLKCDWRLRTPLSDQFVFPHVQDIAWWLSRPTEPSRVGSQLCSRLSSDQGVWVNITLATQIRHGSSERHRIHFSYLFI